MLSTLLRFAVLTLISFWPALPASAPRVVQDGPRPEGEAQLVASLAEQGIQLDPRAGLATIAVTVEVENDLLEYLLVAPGGARHETVFTTAVRPSMLNVALLSLGVEQGVNAQWIPRDPPPSEAERREGAKPYDVKPPEGDGFYLYAAWRRGDEIHFHRIEDLVRNLATGQTMRRHRWVYLGSRMLPARTEGEPEFAADVYQNLINISFFSDGYTLLAGALPECLEQSIWMSNAWLLPPRGTTVRMIFARRRLESAPAELLPLLPDVGPARSPYDPPEEGR
jgi:hypothetical protein